MPATLKSSTSTCPEARAPRIIRARAPYPTRARIIGTRCAGGATTGATNRLSDGTTASPITLTSQLGGTFGAQGTQGTPAGLQQPYEYNSGVLRTDSLNKVPAGTYNLYLYGINNTGTRGTLFTVSHARDAHSHQPGARPTRRRA